MFRQTTSSDCKVNEGKYIEETRMMNLVLSTLRWLSAEEDLMKCLRGVMQRMRRRGSRAGL